MIPGLKKLVCAMALANHRSTRQPSLWKEPTCGEAPVDVRLGGSLGHWAISAECPI